MPRMTGGAAIVRSLVANGVRTVFGLPGLQLDGLFNALHDAGEAIKFIHSRHEQGAAYMAHGFAAASEEVGVYAVVPGPGLLNTTAALSTAYATNQKVFCLTGQIPSAFIGKGMGFLHEIPGQLELLRSQTKWAERIEGAAAAPEIMGEAFRQLHTGRPRPVGVEMAMDVMAAEGEVNPAGAFQPPPFRGAPEPDPDAVEAAARMLGGADHPLIFVGGGAIDAGKEVAAVAEALQAPVVALRTGRGILDARHYLSHTLPAGHRLWPRADVVLTIGTRLHFPQLTWGMDDGLNFVRIEIDPREGDWTAPNTTTLATDSRLALRALLSRLERHNRVRPSREDEMKALKAEMEREFATLEPQMGYLKVLREELPEDGIFVDELTQVGYVGWVAFPVFAPRTYLTTGFQGTLGAGFPMALGAKVANPDKPVLAIAGDGGFLFNVQELATAVRHRIGVVAVVFNDGAYGNVRRMQKEIYGGRVIATDLHNPDFVALAESFGARGVRAETHQALRQAIRQGFQEELPTVIEVPVGEMPSPWDLILKGKARGI